MSNDEDKGFNYTYSTKQRDEVIAIRKKYTPTEPEDVDNITLLRNIDSEVTRKATVRALTTGVIGALLMGTGMSLLMTDLSSTMGLDSWITLLIGIVIGMVGLIIMCVTYPLYNHILERERARVADEVIRLSDELLGE